MRRSVVFPDLDFHVKSRCRAFISSLLRDYIAGISLVVVGIKSISVGLVRGRY